MLDVAHSCVPMLNVIEKVVFSLKFFMEGYWGRSETLFPEWYFDRRIIRCSGMLPSSTYPYVHHGRHMNLFDNNFYLINRDLIFIDMKYFTTSQTHVYVFIIRIRRSPHAGIRI